MSEAERNLERKRQSLQHLGGGGGGGGSVTRIAGSRIKNES